MSMTAEDLDRANAIIQEQNEKNRLAAIPRITDEINMIKKVRGNDLTLVDVRFLKLCYRHRGAWDRRESAYTLKDLHFRVGKARAHAQNLWEHRISTEDLIARRDLYLGFINDRLAKGQTITEQDGHAQGLADVIDELAYRAKKEN